MPPAWKGSCSGDLARRSQGPTPADVLASSMEVASLADHDVTPIPNLPVGVVALFLQKLDGDAAFICAAACVSTTWRGATAVVVRGVAVHTHKRCSETCRMSRSTLSAPLAPTKMSLVRDENGCESKATSPARRPQAPVER